MKQSVLFSLLVLTSAAALAAPPPEQNYAAEGLNIIYRSSAVTYAVDSQNAQLTENGIRLWLQTDFDRPQPISNSAEQQSRNLVRADVDCLGHRLRFSQIRYYGASGELVGGRDPETAWLSPKDGSVGQTLIRQICVTYVPALHEERVAQTSPLQGQAAAH